MAAGLPSRDFRGVLDLHEIHSHHRSRDGLLPRAECRRSIGLRLRECTERVGRTCCRTSEDRCHQLAGSCCETTTSSAVSPTSRKSMIPSVSRSRRSAIDHRFARKRTQAQSATLSDAERASKAKLLDDKQKELKRSGEDAQADFRRICSRPSGPVPAGISPDDERLCGGTRFQPRPR